MTIKIDKAKDGMGDAVFKASFDRWQGGGRWEGDDKWEGEWESDERMAIESLMGTIIKEYREYEQATKSDRERLHTIARMFQAVG
jgi:hypothetical protein